MNREEKQRYSKVEECDFIVELALPADPATGRGDYGMKSVMQSDERSGAWEIFEDEPYLDAERTSGLHRILQVKGIFEGGAYAKYALFEFMPDTTTDEGEIDVA